MVKAAGLFSGGLDSMLAVCLLRKQNIEVEAVTFTTPFFGYERALKSAEHIKVKHNVIDITEDYIEILKNPRYGYGKNMNPCIDCHGFMFKKLGELMPEMKADFLFSGEVLGQRPMSQNRNSLKIVEKISGFEKYILRPLSALLLEETEMEKKGLVDRTLLLDLNGRTRKPQIQLAEEFNINTYPEPAGGCKLTKPGFSNRLKDLLNYEKPPPRLSFELLGIGRHFRISKNIKFIVGRDEQDNDTIIKSKKKDDIIIKARDVTGAVLLICGNPDHEEIKKAVSICLRYSDVDRSKPAPAVVCRGDKNIVLEEKPCGEDFIKNWMVS